MISANGGLPAHRYTPQVTRRWPRGSEPASLQGDVQPDQDKEWPRGRSVEHEKIFLSGRLLVPESRAKGLLDEWHRELMQPSAVRHE